ncbi:transcriptional regulator, AraC family with acetamidase/formamidase activity [Novosphingobium sp. Rr 2-17]|uniref:acetamidase/formamidase family protein n=1 Tax=Novosphingobium sp. Rr 2-17 TaxID=555793 RepID=UPI00026994BD|nr:acetamidase/formamidase family protein [Novosphingobium sp. Rr 2-17]EIZ81013.1 transcriptional regulator, AraC family with acetamidase/formamidase activity [Novosphingobium sp. Rr 2-17]
MTGVRLTTNAYPHDQRLEAWRFALQRVSVELDQADDEVYGDLVSFTSGQKIQFVRVTGTRQALALDLKQEARCFWLALLLEGQLVATGGDATLHVGEGDMIYGGGDTRCLLTMDGDFRLLLVKVPLSLPALKSRSHLPTEISDLIADTAVARMMSSLLRTVADTMLDISDDQIRPVELALPEMIAATLLDRAPAKALGGAAGGRAAILERVFQSIEMRLSDPNLNTHQIASEHNISSRYLQKLFESHGESFGHYVKLRRLERCRLDLGSPLHAQRSISEILFQWGFNDSASFSRAFREQYGMSPREYRKSPDTSSTSSEAPRRGRPEKARDVRLENREAASVLSGLPALDDAARSRRHHFLPARPDTVHWGYFSRSLPPVLEVRSGDYVTIETLTHHANDDAERMIEGDAGAESVFHWTAEGKAVERRGAGPFDASAMGRGPGEGFGVHICTGPIAIEGARPGDVIEVRILDMENRPSQNPRFAGRSFGSNVAAYWGFHYNDLLTEPKQREVITIYEMDTEPGHAAAHAVYSYRWTPQTDPSGIVHNRYDYPGVPVDPETITRNFDVLRDVTIPVRPHFGVVALAPAHSELIDSVPPANFGGNIDNWRLGAGASVFLPVGVPGGLLSMGDPHASQGDSELCGTAIECSMTAVIQVILHPAKTSRKYIRDIDYPLIETKDEWVILGFSSPEYLKDLGANAQSEVYKQSSIDTAMRDAFRKARRFLMTLRDLTEDEVISLLSVGVDFGISQVANGNWGVHAVIRKSLFSS